MPNLLSGLALFAEFGAFVHADIRHTWIDEHVPVVTNHPLVTELAGAFLLLAKELATHGFRLARTVLDKRYSGSFRFGASSYRSRRRGSGSGGRCG